MHARRALLTLATVVWCVTRVGADTYPRQPGVDAVHYVFRLTLGDLTSEIQGETTARIRFVADGVRELTLDLASPTGTKGMTVLRVTAGARPVAYVHKSDRLLLTVDAPPRAGDDVSFTVQYKGVPAAGLHLIDNIHGERVAFSENWPDRARQWLPTIDHPSDKATGEFIVTAPARYQVVANGLLVEEVDLDGDRRRTHWRQSVPIASWLFALGVARFATHHYDVVRGIPQQVWAFPQDRDKAYPIFEFTGRRAFEYFSDWVGPYAYEKLAHVEASGFSGGMEHATAIFYGDKDIASGRAPVVHEVAHHWWGDSVTEKDWDDVWLSEGFATYFAHLYTEQFEGREAFMRAMKTDVATIVEEHKKIPEQPVIHRNISDMSTVLNRFVYQKGGWVLHMLRGLIGTDAFWTGIREYYRRYRNANASTDDLRQVMEQVSGQDLTWFFDQWLRRPGLVKLSGVWRYDASAKHIVVELAQVQLGEPYRIPLEVGVVEIAGKMRTERVELTGAKGRFTIAAEAAPSSVVLDPNTWVLMEAPEFVRKQAESFSPRADKGQPAGGR